MRLLVPIPGLDGAQWMVDVWPFGSPYATANQLPPTPYSFVGSPSPFARTLPISPFPGSPWAGLGPHVCCADVLHALYRMLRRRAVADDFWALDARRRDRVSKAFWVRCRAAGAEAAARGQGAPPSLGQGEMDRQVQSGVKRIDFMEGKTRCVFFFSVFCETVPELFIKINFGSLADKRLSFAVDGKVSSGEIRMNGS